MDVHRCRFVPFPASAINAVAFSHSSLPHKKTKRPAPVRLAIGRANGDIELWNPLDGTWHQEIIIHGGKDRSVDALAWITPEDERLDNGFAIHGKSRLFSIGYTVSVTEWDLENATAKRHASSGSHGELWCLAVQPPSPKDKSQLLAAGTVDGNIVLYSTDDDDLRFQRLLRLPKGSSKVISIAFQSRHVLVAGCADSTIRVVDIRNGLIKRNMTLGRDLVSGSKNIIVWSVKCLPDGDIVSGDSSGQICIWDGKTYTQAQRIQGHTQDVLSLATSADGSTIISGGMDRKTAVYQRSPGKAVRWTKLWHRRHHEHDVKTMASFEGRGLSVVVTGGPDCVPVVMPLAKSSSENQRRLSHLPQSTPVTSAPKARLLVGWWDREVHIWKIHKPIDEVLSRPDVEQAVEQNRKLLGRIMIKGDSNITSASTSQDGTLLVVCTTTDVKAFRLKLPTEQYDELSVSKVTLPAAVASYGATNAAISPDCQWLCLSNTGGRLATVKINQDSPDGSVSITSNPTRLKRLRRTISKNELLGGLGSYNRHITYLAFSPDSNVLATVDLAGYIDSWVLGNGTQNGSKSTRDGDASSESSSDEESDHDAAQTSSGPRWIRNPKANLIPKLPQAPTAFAFSPDVPSKSSNRDYILIAIDTSAEIYAFMPLKGRLAPWQLALKRSRLPLEYRNAHDFAKGVLWQGPRLWVYSVSFILMIDTSIDPRSQEATGFWSMHQEEGTKRKRKLDSGAGGRSDADLVPKHVKVTAEEEDGADGDWVPMEVGDSLGKREEDTEGDDDESDDDDDREIRKLNNQLGVQVEKKRWWHTFQYRHILGIVPLLAEDAVVDEQAARTYPYPPIEVAIVERSPWDLDVAERFVGENER